MRPNLRTAAGAVTVSLLLAGAPAVARPGPQDPPPDPSAPVKAVVIPAGTRLQLVLNNDLSTRDSHPGDGFYALVDFPVFVGRTLAIPADSLVRGSIVDVERAGRIRGRSQITLAFESLMLLNGVTKPIDAEIFSMNDASELAAVAGGGRLRGPSSKGRDVAIMVATGAEGAAIGAIAGGGKGLAIGSAAGGLAGLSILLANRGRDVYLDRGLSFEIILQQPVPLAAGEWDFSNTPVMPERRRYDDRSRRRWERRYPDYYPGHHGPWLYP